MKGKNRQHPHITNLRYRYSAHKCVVPGPRELEPVVPLQHTARVRVRLLDSSIAAGPRERGNAHFYADAAG
jgi:hypothetical protein